MGKYTIVYTRDVLGVDLFCVRRIKAEEGLSESEILERTGIYKGSVFIGWPLQPGEEEFDGQEV